MEIVEMYVNWQTSPNNQLATPIFMNVFKNCYKYTFLVLASFSWGDGKYTLYTDEKDYFLNLLISSIFFLLKTTFNWNFDQKLVFDTC